MTNHEIDQAAAALINLLKMAGAAYPAVALAMPLITFLVRHEAHKLKAGLADGSIIPDGRGGFVPASNSRFDPKTGEFLD